MSEKQPRPSHEIAAHVRWAFCVFVVLIGFSCVHNDKGGYPTADGPSEGIPTRVPHLGGAQETERRDHAPVVTIDQPGTCRIGLLTVRDTYRDPCGYRLGTRYIITDDGTFWRVGAAGAIVKCR